MNRTVDDWTRKAENDLRTAEREIAVPEIRIMMQCVSIPSRLLKK